MLQTNTTSKSRQCIRDKIKPFGGWSPEQKRFAVGWQSTPLTFAQIIADLKEGVLQDLRYFRKLESHHFPDLLQQGWLRLWQALHENENALALMPKIKAVDFIANRCGVSKLKSYLSRYSSYHDFTAWDEFSTDTYEDNITEIVIGSSLKSSGKPGHALFTRVVDRLIDIQKAICEVVEWCQEDIKKLAALYYLTTSVSHADAGRIAGFPIYHHQGRQKCPKLTHWARIVREKLYEVLANYRPLEPNLNQWREQLEAGNTKPVEELALKYAHDSDSLLALYILTTSVSQETIVKECGISDSALRYKMKQLRQELRYRYARCVP